MPKLCNVKCSPNELKVVIMPGKIRPQTVKKCPVKQPEVLNIEFSLEQKVGIVLNEYLI